jgi:hypothetical protein
MACLDIIEHPHLFSAKKSNINRREKKSYKKKLQKSGNVKLRIVSHTTYKFIQSSDSQKEAQFP